LMNILITSAGEKFSVRLAEALGKTHELRLTDRRRTPEGTPVVVSQLGDDESTDDLVKDIDVIVHWGKPDPEASDSEQLDQAMRCTYNLLWAASRAGVSRFVYLSSLSVMERHDDAHAVTEQWRPAPTTEMAGLCNHLGEYVCREFARESRIDVVCLRFGDITWDGEPASTSALYVEDAVQAVDRALGLEFGEERFVWVQQELRTPGGRRKLGTSPNTYWHLFHIQSEVPNARFLTLNAQTDLGYAPGQAGSREGA